MSKRILIIISTILILIIIGLFGTAYFVGRTTNQSTGEVLQDILPFGQGGNNSSQDFTDTSFDAIEDTDTIRDSNPVGSAQSKLQQLTTTPTVGVGVFANEGSLVVRYVERATGNVYQIDATGNNKQRLTNSTLLGVQTIVWGESGESVALQYLDEAGIIKTFIGNVTTDTGTSTEAAPVKLDGEFIDNDITALVSSPTKKDLFYIIEFGSSSIGTIFSFENEQKEQIFSHVLKEWLVSWPQEARIALTTKPSFAAKGYSFLLNRNTESLNLVVGDLYGLGVNYRPDTGAVLVSNTANESVQTRLYDIDTNDFLDFPLTTLAEKCVWSKKNLDIIYCAAPESVPRGDYPDDWYKGVAVWGDNLWRINTFSNSVSLVASPQDVARQTIDVTDITIDSDEKYLFFIDKKTGTLWRASL